VETLHVSVLHRPSRLHVDRLHSLFDAPCQVVPAGQFRPVVGPQRRRPSVLRHEVLQYSRHPAAGKARVHLQRQALPRVSVHHAEDPQPPLRVRHIAGKVDRPLLVRRCQRAPRRGRPCQPLAAQPLHRQPGCPVHPLHALVIHGPPIPCQQDLQPTVAQPRLLLRQRHQALPQLCVIPPAHIAAGRSRNLHQLAGMPLAEAIRRHPPLHFRASPYEPKRLFRITERSCFTSCASLTSIPPYLARQA